MLQSGKDPFITKKCYEVAYALFRIGANMPEKSFADKMTSEGLSLLTAGAADKYEDALRSLGAIEYFIRLGVDLNFITLANGNLLIKEIAGLDAAISTSLNPAITKEVDLSGIFSKLPYIKEESFAAHEEKAKEAPSEHPTPNEIGGLIKSAIRQTTILDKIRQSGNCRMRDIQELLPESSERTIRYDLQALIEQNVIERVGSGGPSVFYKIKQVA